METAPNQQQPGARGTDGNGRRSGHITAALLVVAVALMIPIGLLWDVYQRESTVTALTASALAVNFQARVTSNWRNEAQRVLALEAIANDKSALYMITDAAGLEVAQTGSVPSKPRLTRTASLVGPTGPIGEVAVTRTLIQSGTLTATCLFVLLSTVAFVVLRVTLRNGPLSWRGFTAAVAVTRQQGPIVTAESEREVEARLRIVFENSIDGIMTCLPSGIVVSCNPAACRLFDQPAAKLLGQNLGELVAPWGDADGNAKFPTGLHETVAQCKGGKQVPVEITVSDSRLKGVAQVIVIVRDITERKATHDRMAFLANYDSLTGLPNRGLFRDRLREGMKRAKRNGTTMALMFLDLDRFKVVNDSLGHEAGDRLLKHVSETLVHRLRAADTIALDSSENRITVSRLGGDEFTIILEDIGDKDDAALIARRVLEALNEPFVLRKQEIVISTSIGISLYPQDDTDLDGLIRHTDTAMYRSKALGRGTYCFFSPDMNAEAQAQLSLETNLRHALERNEFVLYYQPKADLHTGEIVGVEALIRWNRPGEAQVPPEQFIPLLEETGLILPVGAWVIRTACAELASWDRMGLPRLSLAVNLSPRQFRQQYLFQLIADTLEETEIAPYRLELELTESQLMEDTQTSRDILASVAKLGVRVAIDDFGTGHSSLSYLKRFSINTIKIDRSFVREITSDQDDSAIATAVLAMGHSLRLKVVAEGVETLHQADYLRALGCDEVQGYLLSPPLPAAKLVAWLKSRSSRILVPERESVTHSPDWAPSTLLSMDL